MQKYQGKIFASWMLVLVFLSCTKGEGGVEPAQHCCRKKGSDSTRLVLKNCTEKNTLELGCELKYLHEPHRWNENMTTVVIGNQTWLSMMESPELVAPNRYCLTTLKDTSEPAAFICMEDVSSIKAFLKSPWLTAVLATASCVFLGLTLLVYLRLKQMRELQDIAIMSMLGSYMVGYAMFARGYLAPAPVDSLHGASLSCLIPALVMYYAFLAAFFWMHVIALNISRLVWLSKWEINSNSLLKIYSGIGWGMPLLLLLLTLVAHHVDDFILKPGFKDGFCWFSGLLQLWVYFYGPMFFLMVANLVLLGFTGFKLWYLHREIDSSRTKLLKFKCLMLLKLYLLTGINWIFEILSFAIRNDYFFWLLTDLLNISQGVIIFFLLVVFRKKVRNLLAQTRPCGIRFPKSWETHKNEHTIIDPDELDLSD